MHTLACKITDLCLSKDFISSAQAPWLVYALEKRFATVLVGIPFFLLAP